MQNCVIGQAYDHKTRFSEGTPQGGSNGHGNRNEDFRQLVEALTRRPNKHSKLDTCLYLIFTDGIHTRIKAIRSGAPDAYLYHTDDTKIHGLMQCGGKCIVIFDRK
ncbi:unnamed protein product [Didymodactylos carnosus]|uniref:Uncharacterized protein n=1 Tax=Didymodactylos carnosus TaxID=1234261 RepID=A0A815CGR8_9BILA|nr:unnamed protein product [Didymodactylos carnosus]CAF4074905.1 unnamed protein product [Didymodactylos carnosus]